MNHKSNNQKNISQPDQHGWQVRIVREGKQHSRYFAHKQYGSRQKSLKAAIRWRDLMQVVLPKRKPFFTRLASNQSTGVIGVSRAIHHDKRRDTAYLRYQVSYQQKNGRSASKTFQVGPADRVTAEQERHAFLTAIQFRKDYEQSRLNRESFDSERFLQWRNERLYSLEVERQNPVTEENYLEQTAA